MRYIKLPILIATLFCSTLIYAQDAPIVGRSETTLEREGRVIAEQKAADQQRFYLQLVVIGAVAFAVVVMGWVFLVRKGPAIARSLVEMRPFDGRSSRSSLQEIMIAEPEVTARRRPGSGLIPTLPEILVAEPERRSRHSVDIGRAEPVPGIYAAEPVRPSRMNEPELTPVSVADSCLSSSSYELQYILVRSSDDPTRLRLSRIYVLPEELVVIANGEVGNVNELVYAGGGGSNWSGEGTSSVADVRLANDDAMQRLYSRFDPMAARESSKSGGDFRMRLTDVTEVSIDPILGPAKSEGISRAVGTLRFRHRERGEFSYEILSLVEVRGAIRLLTRALGKSVNVSKEWEELIPTYLSSL